MLKIFSPQLGLSPHSNLGGEVHDFNLIDHLCQQGVNVTVLLPKNKPYQPHKNLKVIYMPISHLIPPYLISFILLFYIFKQKFDILRIHNPYFLGLTLPIIKMHNPKVKIVTTIHLKEESKLFDVIFRKTYHLYDHFFVVSLFLKKWLVNQYGIPSHKITVIYNGFDQSLLEKNKSNKISKKYNLANKQILLTVGSLIKRKNFLFLIKVFEKLSFEYPNLRLLICGKGILKNELIKQIKTRRFEKKIILIDSIQGNLKREVFNLADIFLFPSLNEGFGLVGVEAMICKKPVIVANNSSLPEIIDNNKTGFLSKTSDQDDWVKKIRMLLNDQKMREKMGRDGFKKAKSQFSWEKVAQRTIKVYKNIVIL